jgi:ribosome-binding factor A
MDAHRTRRVAEAIREELIELIQFEAQDPRMAGVEVTAVDLDPGLRHARVRVTVAGEKAAADAALAALDHARHYFRRELSARLHTWRNPELHFEIDLGAEAGDRIDKLLEAAARWRAKMSPPPGG